MNLLVDGAFFYLASSFALGALHALEPGHGKTIVAAYLVGSQGRPKHALALGAIVTFTHTIGIILLAVLTQILAKNVDLERLHPVFETGAATIVLIVGVWMLRRNLYDLRHHHEHAHTHEHKPDQKAEVFWKDLVFLGVSGGLIPCPAAFAVLLTSISAGKPENGLLWVLSFSVGLAFVLIILGIMVIKAAQWVGRKLSTNQWLDRTPLFSSIIILLMGGIMLSRALFEYL
ncbi:MAG TPA: sulfite exporter TauE/SafE family protein [candidate division Zixibacteria bacterium]|nr:sulfite exporter TauE/SafE family protein [candidate division Zixibacteria bacterium]